MVSSHSSYPSYVYILRIGIVLGVLMTSSFTDWFFFLVLNIGISDFDSIPVGQRFLIGLVQAISVRSTGFQAITISSLAPAQQ